MKKAFVCFGFLLLFFSVFSQETPKDSVSYLQEVVIIDAVKASKTAGITPSHVIQGDFLENQSPTDMVATINQVSGVYILSGALNTNRITIRGVGSRTLFGTDKLRLYFNDIPVTNGSGFSTIEAFDLENIQNIEVIKGPKGTLFGANLGGAILLNTQRELPQTTALSNSFTSGSYGLVKNNLSFTHRETGFALDFRYGHLSTDGYRENNSFDRDGFLLNSSFETGPKNRLDLLVNYIDYTAQIPSSLGQTAFNEDPTQAAFTWAQAQGFEANKYSLIGLANTYEISEQVKNTTSVFYTYLDHYEPRPFNILDEFTNGYGFRSRFYGSFSLLGRKTEYNLGAEFYRDEYSWATYENLYQQNNGNGSLQGDQISDNQEFRRQFNGFATLTLPLSDTFKAQLGINVNKTHYNFRDRFNSGNANRSASRNFDPIFLPNIGLEYTPNYKLRFYASFSRGFSNPSLEETLTPDGVINPDIAQETGNSYEFGSRFTFWPKTKLWFDLTVYRMDIKNLLVADRVGEDQFIGRNAGKTRHQGLEFQLDYQIDLGSETSLSPFASYTLNDHSFVDFVDRENDFSGNPLTGVPKNRLNLGFRLQHTKDLYWSATYQHVGAIPLTDTNSLSSEPFNLVNTRAGYQKEISKRFTLGVTAGINNLFNIRYAQSVLINARGFGGNEPRYFYPGNDRNFYGGLQLRYLL